MARLRFGNFRCATSRSIRSKSSSSIERVAVIYPGARRYSLDERVEAVPLATLAEPGRLFGEDVV